MAKVKKSSDSSPKPWYRRAMTWILGIIIASIAGVIGASFTGAIKGIVPSPDEFSCMAKQVFEPKAREDQFAVIIFAFQGDTGSKYQKEVARALRDGTGLAVLETCYAPTYRSGSFAESERQIGQTVSDLLSKRNADVGIWGEVNVSDISLHYLNRWGSDYAPYGADRIKLEKITERLSDDCPREGGCFLGNNSEFENVVLWPFAGGDWPLPLDQRDKQQPLRHLADKISALESSAVGHNRNWAALRDLSHTLSAEEAGLRARHAEIIHNESEARDAVDLLLTTFRNEGFDPLTDEPRAGDRAFWLIYYDQVLEAYAKESRSGDALEAANRLVVFRKHENRDSALGSALVLRWRITKDEKDLRGGVALLRAGLQREKQAGATDMESVWEYRELLRLKNEGAITSINGKD